MIIAIAMIMIASIMVGRIVIMMPRSAVPRVPAPWRAGSHNQQVSEGIQEEPFRAGILRE
jgi:hypothetical protein